MKTIMKRVLVFLLIGGGIATLSYPAISNWLISRNQTAVIISYGQTVDEMNEQKKQEELEKAQKYNDHLSGNGIVDPFIPDSGYVLPGEYLSILNIGGVIGYIDIPKIDVFLPIYHGTDEETLTKGVGHLQNTAFPIGGEGNHSVLTGHRGLSSAKLLTDLDQLEFGDHFYITVLDDVLAYEVDQILTVDPSDTSELIPTDGKDYVTLITCTPYGVNSHRLFIRGTRIPYVTDEAEMENTEESNWFCFILVVTGFVILLATYFGLRKYLNKRKKSE